MTIHPSLMMREMDSLSATEQLAPAEVISPSRKKVVILGEASVHSQDPTMVGLTDDESTSPKPTTGTRTSLVSPQKQSSLPTIKMERSATSADYTSDSRHKTPAVLKTSKSVLYGRLLFLLVLAAAAASLGYVAYSLMADSEEQLASERFDSIAKRALSTAQLVFESKKKATDSLALMVATTNPDPDAWPNVYMEGYQEIAASLRIVTQGSLSFCPIVIPGGEEQASFEAFAYQLFRDIQHFPNETGVSDFGEGIFSFDFGNESLPDGRFHITSGWTYHNSSRNILVPFLQSDYGPHEVLMLNIHYEHYRAAAIDQVITCSEERARSMDYQRECGGLTDLMWSETAANVEPGPAGLMMIPIYPRDDNLTLTGFIVGKQIWHDLLVHGFESDVTGVTVVLRTESESFTYRVVNGNVSFVEDEDAFIGSNAKFKMTGRHINPNYFSNLTVKYYMDVYSNPDFYVAYSTNNPRTACIGAVLIMLGTSLLFFCYDYFVRKEFHDKRRLLEAKRQFVRFVSHEVRTPLNTVCMGLTLMQHDFATALGLRHNKGGGPRAKTTDVASDETRVRGVSSSETVDLLQVQEWMQLSTQVYQNAETAVNVLSDLLNYDKIQMGTLTLELSLVSILHLLEKTVNEFKIAARESKVNLDLDLFPLIDGNDNRPDVESGTLTINQLPPDIRDVKVVADHVRLAQVFRNLLSNGLKFSNEGGKLTLRVSVIPSSSRKPKPELVSLHKEQKASVIRRGTINIEVIDEGVGMSPEQVKTVFNDGTQFNANQFQAGGGSGLGLNIAQGIVVGHGGKLSCTSPGIGLGTTFVLSLPLYDPLHLSPPTSDIAVLDVSKESVAKETDSDFVVPQLHILVVDDSLTNRKLCIRLLERNGHTCEGACDGDEAVAMVKASLSSGKLYDCILLDYEMPKMNGPEACQQMRRMGCSAYIAGVTGNLMSEDVDHFRMCGANWVFPKPFRLEALEEQWIEDGVTPSSANEGSGMVRVESGGQLEDLCGLEGQEYHA